MNLTKHWAVELDDYVIDLAWSPTGRTLAAASAAGPVALLAAEDGHRQHVLPGHAAGSNVLAWRRAATEPALATGGQDGAVKLWDGTAGQHLATTTLGPAWVEQLAWRPAGDPALLAAAAGRELCLLRADGSEAHRFPPAAKTLSALAWHPAGDRLAAAGFGGIQVWNTDDFDRRTSYAYANGILALAWSPDGRWLVSGNQDPSVHLWQPEQDAEFHMSGYENKVSALSFDRSSRWLATNGGRDACVWECSGAGPEGREPAMLPHEAKVGPVAFQTTHGLLATAAADGAVLLWSPERRQPLRASLRLPAAATKLAWSPDDRHLAIGSEQGVVYVLKVEA